MIAVTKTFLPPFDVYTHILKRAWDKVWITNNGELLQELESKLASYLGARNVLFCGNGTIVLQLAIKAMNITGEVITTPFSYVATTNALLWENCTPVYDLPYLMLVCCTVWMITAIIQILHTRRSNDLLAIFLGTFAPLYLLLGMFSGLGIGGGKGGGDAANFPRLPAACGPDRCFSGALWA